MYTCAINRKYADKIRSWKIGDDLGSDHLPLIFELGINANKRKATYRTRWFYEKYNEKTFENVLKSNIEEIISQKN